jgi:amino acid adenylation domain-containing protein
MPTDTSTSVSGTASTPNEAGNGRGPQAWNWRQSWKDSVPNYPPIQRREKEGEYQLSPRQEELWFLSQLEGGHLAYNVPMAWRLRGELNLTALQQSLDELIARHETLRTIYPSLDGQPCGIVTQARDVALEKVDLTGVPGADREARLERLLDRQIARPFDLARGPMFRAVLAQMGPQDHALLLLMHHIGSDGTSTGILSSDFTQLYNAFARGQSSPLEPLPVQYADYALWQQQWLPGGVHDKQLAYWKQRLQDAPALLELPADRPRQAVASFRGAVQHFLVDRALSDALHALSRREGVTLFMTLLAAYQTLLHRYNGQQEIVVGAPCAGRNRVELQRLIGFFVNMLPLRTDVSGDPTFRDLLKRVRETAVGAFAHQDIPFGDLVRALHPDRQTGTIPLVQAVLVQEQAAWRKLPLEGLQTEWLPIHNRTTKFDLSLYWNEDESGIHSSWEYSTDAFDSSTITRMTGHFLTLLHSVVSDPSRAISELPILPQRERDQLLIEWNNTKVDYPRDVSLHSFIESQVAKVPSAPALICESQQLSYRELNEKSNQLAHYLRKAGVGPDVLVGICAERSAEMVVGLLGIMKAGGAYVPLDPEYPKDRLATMIEDAKPPVILTQERLLSCLPDSGCPVFCLDRDCGKLEGESRSNPGVKLAGHNLAYAIYTSGSTGKPKGVANVHAGIVNRLLWMQDEYGLNSTDRVLQKTPYSFDVSVWEFFWPLMTGACLVMARPGGHRDALYLASVIQECKITTLHFVPSMLQIFLEASAAGQCTNLRRVFCSGEALPYELTERFFQVLPSVELHNLYGPTEAAVDVTYWACQPKSRRSVVPIGRPVANTQIYVLDKRLQPVPIGIPGELHIGGIQLAREYLNRPDLTAEKFIHDPYGSSPDARLYKTGDLARVMPDASVEYLGRIDHQVKIRGFRIELGEIEIALGECPGVAQSVVMAREDEPGNKRLVAYILRAGDQPPDEDQMREHLRQKLPEYMVPSAFVIMEDFPLSSNGKVDRKALPKPEIRRSDEIGSYVAPRNQKEEQLADIWQKTLGIEKVGMTDNFFDLGGHSLLGARLFARIEKAFGKKLPLATIFRAPTVEKLAGLLSDEHSPNWLVEIQSGGSRPPFFFVHARMGYRLLARELGPEQPVYVLPYDDMFEDKLDRSLEQVAGDLVARLRSVQPEGPYYLGGMCLAGRVAFAMAQELYAQGQEVALLVIFDSPAPGYSALALNGNRWQNAAARVKAHLANFLQEDRESSYAKWVLWHVRNGLWKAGYQASHRLGRKLPFVAKDSYRLMSRAGHAYRSGGPYPGRITLFRPASSPLYRNPDPALGWSEIAVNGVEVHQVSGQHTSLLKEPSVTQIAQELADCLRRAQANAEELVAS